MLNAPNLIRCKGASTPVHLKSLALALALFATAAAWAAPGSDGWDLGSLFEGKPAALGSRLPEISYVPVQAKRLKNARLLWVNWDLLRLKGVPIPKTVDEYAIFEKSVLDRVAYTIPRPGIDDESIGEATQEFYADRYGGYGISYNFGSGRAMVAGSVQVKGGGVTPLLGNGASFGNSHGGTNFPEGHRDALFGEVANNELPYGANRDYFIIDTGTETVYANGSRKPRVLIVREDPARPAHYVDVWHGSWGHAYAHNDVARTREAQRLLPETLPLPEDLDASSLTPADRISAGMKEYATRMARQYATAYAKRLFHGATSHSNYDISGRWLDFGTTTTLSGWAPAKVLGHVAPFGDTAEIKKYLIGDLTVAINTYSLYDIKVDSQPLLELFDQEYERTLKIEVIRLAGFPDTIVERLISAQVTENLARSIRAVMTAPHEGVTGYYDVDKLVPEMMGAYDVPAVLNLLVKHATDSDARPALDAVRDKIADQSLAESLVSDFRSYFNEATQLAKADGVTRASLARFLTITAPQRNRTRPELFRSTLDGIESTLQSNYRESHDARDFSKELDQLIDSARTRYEETGPYEAVVREARDHRSGRIERVVFNARTGRTRRASGIQIDAANIRWNSKPSFKLLAEPCELALLP